MKRLLVAALVLLGSSVRGEEKGELTVFAAASLREVFEDLGQKLELRSPGLKVRFNFAGSQELRTQIEQGANADVFASADQKHMGALEKAGRVVSPRVFARNSPAIVVPKGNPAGIAAFDALPRAKRLVIGTPEVPIGSYTLQILDKAGSEFKDKVLARVVSRELNVRQVLAKVTLGEADAGVVYMTDAITARDKIEIVPIPPKFNVEAEYPVAVLKDAKNSAAARAFVDLLLSSDGQKRLSAAGFTVGR